MVVNSTLMGLKLLLLVAGVVGMKGDGRRKLKNQGLTKQLQEAGTEIKEITTMGNLQDTITTITEMIARHGDFDPVYYDEDTFTAGGNGSGERTRPRAGWWWWQQAPNNLSHFSNGNGNGNGNKERENKNDNDRNSKTTPTTIDEKYESDCFFNLIDLVLFCFFTIF